jgi:heat shock protein HtpX
MATLYTEQGKNVRKTWLLMAGFLAFIIFIGWFLSYYYGNPAILLFAIIFSLVMNIASFWHSDKIALAVSGARPIAREDNPELWNVVENLAITAGLPMPKLYLINDPAPNAFATGRDKEHAAVAVTEGLLRTLNKTELEGVIAHELSHVGNRDILLSTVVVTLVGLITLASHFFLRARFFGFGGRGNNERGGGQLQAVMMIVGVVLMILSPVIATIIQLAISRKREFLADASGALLTRYPEGLASALKKISSFNQPMIRANNATAHLFISNPFGRQKIGSGIVKLFMTHPPVEERIEALIGRETNSFLNS